MSQAIAAMLSSAIGVAISPFPIGGVTLLLTGKKGRADSIFFTVGWMVGNGVIYIIALLSMDSVATASAYGGRQMQTIVHLLIAALLIFLAFRSIRKIPKAGQKVTPPRWLDKMESMGPLGAFGIAITLSALNPVNMALSFSAGVSVGKLTLTAAQYAWSVLVFILIASSTILAPTLIFLIAGHRIEGALHKLYNWLIRNGELILAVLFFVLAVENILKAL